jgi:hypothetical protein
MPKLSATAVPAPRPETLVTCAHVFEGKAKPRVSVDIKGAKVVCANCFKSETEEFVQIVSFAVLDAKLNGTLAQILNGARTIDDSLASAPDPFFEQEPEPEPDEAESEDSEPEEDEPEFEDPDETANGKRQDEAGAVTEEKVARDYVFLTTRELGEDGAPKRNQRTDREIHQQLMENPTLIPPRCEIHSTPGCFSCAHTLRLLQYYEDHPEKRTNEGLPTPPKYSETSAQRVAPITKVLSLEEEVKQVLENSRIAKAAKNPTQAKPKKWEPKKIENLRRIHGYSARDLASCFDDPGFNDKVPRTDYRLLSSDERIPEKHLHSNTEIRNMKWRELHQQVTNGERAGRRHPQTLAELLNMLPLALFPLFTPGQVAFYRDYAGGNFRKEELEFRIANGFYGRAGFETQDYLVVFENRIIVRAWQRLLLKPKTEVRVEDFDRLLQAGHDAETLAIASGAASIGSVISAKWKDTPGKTFGLRGLDSFEHGGHIQSGDGLGDFSQEGGADHDDFSDEGAA